MKVAAKVRKLIGLSIQLYLLSSLSSISSLWAGTFEYKHVLGTGDMVWDPIASQSLPIAACDSGAILDWGLMHNVCSVNGDFNTDGGIYHPPSGGIPYRTFRREDPLPGQSVSFNDSPIPFGYPALKSDSGDTYVTALFSTSAGSQKGLYKYGFWDNAMSVVVDTTVPSVPHEPASNWTDFSINLGISDAGVFFKGTYNYNGTGTLFQGLYQYTSGQLSELLENPTNVSVPGRNQFFANYRTVAANSRTLLFVGEFSNGKGIYALDLTTHSLTKVIDNLTPVPGGGTFTDFAQEPMNTVHGASLVINEGGTIAVVANYRKGLSNTSGIFLLNSQGGSYSIQPILAGGVSDPNLLTPTIQSFHTLSLNSRGELAFVVANNDQSVPIQGLVFYRGGALQSVFKYGDSFLAELKHPSPQFTTYAYAGLVSGNQALDSANPPHIFFRHTYKVSGYPMPFVMMAIATLNP